MKDHDGYNDIVLLWESIWTCSAQKRHLLALKREKKAKEAKEAAENATKLKPTVEPEAGPSVAPESPLIDLNSVSMKALQEKDIAKEMDKMEVCDNKDEESSCSSDSGTVSGAQNQSQKTKVPNSRSEPALNYFIPQPKRLSDTELYVLCICLCIIRRERDLIMAQKFDATEILKVRFVCLFCFIVF